jgi:Anti-sigma-K factor rskA
MSDRDHTLIEELMAGAALGGLDPADQQRLEHQRAAHDPCEECRDLESDFAEIAGRLAFSLDPEPVDMAVADRILAEGGRVAVIPDIGAATVLEEPVMAAPEPDPARYKAHRGRRGRRWAMGVGIAAALGLALVASLTYLPGLRPVPTHPVATQRFVHFAAQPGSSEQGDLAMAYTQGSRGVVLWGSDLPDPGVGKVYEVWMISGTTPVSGGCLQPTGGRIAAYVDADIGTADVMAVTTESNACPSAPTVTPVLTASLTA